MGFQTIVFNKYRRNHRYSTISQQNRFGKKGGEKQEMQCTPAVGKSGNTIS